MAALSMTHGTPVGEEMALVRMADKTIAYEKTGRFIGLVDGKEMEELGVGDPIEVLGEDYIRALRLPSGGKLSVDQLTELLECVEAGEDVLDPELASLFETVWADYRGKEEKEIKLPGENVVFPLPIEGKTRECPYIAAPSGAGKSTYAARFCDAVREMEPDKKIYIFSRLAVDPALDALAPERFICDAKLVASPPTPEALQNSIVIFDDIDTLPDKVVAACVQKIRDDLLETGRHESVTVLSTSHQLLNYSKTRTLLNEATSVTFFPGSSNYHIQSYLKRYGGCSAKMIAKIMALKSRWVTHYRTMPPFFVHERGAFTIDAE